MKRTYLDKMWAGLQWTPWYSFNEIMDNKRLLPNTPGMYRIKAKGHEPLMYIGQTGRDLRERLTDLIRNTMKEEMPFNDPHTAAPSLWAWKDAEGWEFECSVATIHLTKENREGLECFLLWNYRLEEGESTFCNHGRFHSDYEKSKARKSGFRGGKLQDDKPRNHAWGKSYAPLQFKGAPLSSDFMGLTWSNFRTIDDLQSIPQIEGVYRIKGKETNTILYFGQSIKLRSRLQSHSKKDWNQPVEFSYCLIKGAKDYHLKEIENDLIGAFYSIKQKVPEYQFKNLKEGW